MSQIENRSINKSKWKSRLIVYLVWQWTLYKQEIVFVPVMTMIDSSIKSQSLFSQHFFPFFWRFQLISDIQASGDRIYWENRRTEKNRCLFLIDHFWMRLILSVLLPASCVTKRFTTPASSSTIVPVCIMRWYNWWPYLFRCPPPSPLSSLLSLILLSLSLFISPFCCGLTSPLLSRNTDHPVRRSFGFQMRCVVN